MVFVTFGTGFAPGLSSTAVYTAELTAPGIGHIRLTDGDDDPVGYRKRGSVEGGAAAAVQQTGAAYVRRESLRGAKIRFYGSAPAKTKKRHRPDRRSADEGDPLSVRFTGESGDVRLHLRDYNRPFDPEMIVAGRIFMRRRI